MAYPFESGEVTASILYWWMEQHVTTLQSVLPLSLIVNKKGDEGMAKCFSKKFALI